MDFSENAQKACEVLKQKGFNASVIDDMVVINVFKTDLSDSMDIEISEREIDALAHEYDEYGYGD